MHRLPHLLGGVQNVWTSREGIEYGWFNNVETKPGRGFPRDWEDQDKWHGGWQRVNGQLTPRMGGKLSLLAKIFANPHMPAIGDYYEPYSFDYAHLHNAPAGARHQPTARPYSLLTGKTLEKIEGSANWEDDWRRSPRPSGRPQSGWAGQTAVCPV